MLIIHLMGLVPLYCQFFFSKLTSAHGTFFKELLILAEVLDAY